ncbi:hypothetical protein AGMMS50229_16840 [Campylobacterota bacterium]|nr:hypothetical protein AGMMS50229_16840 [Campylobacterota bacterium]
MKTFADLKQLLKSDRSHLAAIRVALLGDSATQFLATALQGTGVERGFDVALREADFAQIERQLLDLSSETYAFGAKYVIVFQSTHKLLDTYNALPPEKRSTLADDRLAFIRQLDALFANRKERLIYCNYPEIDDGVYGSYAGRVESSFLFQVRKLNYFLMQSAHNIYLCDLASIQNKIGRDTIFDSSIYATTEMLLSIDSVPLVAARMFDCILAAEGRINKCVVCDLDNTLWGGVIGDDGIENIELGHLGIGKSFSEFGQWLKKLKERGIILAVCSKNNEETAKEPFIKHPEMALRLEDISVFVANWENKADNIRRIQQILNIGFDSMVFLDDNPAERAIVRENIPAITVPELPEDPADYLEYLYELNLFETISVSAEDAERTKQYQSEAKRQEELTHFANEADFLKSLDMRCEVDRFNPYNTPRVAQLSQRSNQFNLRTIRYTDTDIARLGSDDRYANFAFSLGDKFGDHGLICVVILEIWADKTLFIDTWFMSCRVLKRGMENFTLNTIVQYAKDHGFERLAGEYIATPKNKMVKNHYDTLGFTQTADGDRQLYTLDVAAYSEHECFITKVHNEIR